MLSFGEYFLFNLLPKHINPLQSPTLTHEPSSISYLLHLLHCAVLGEEEGQARTAQARFLQHAIHHSLGIQHGIVSESPVKEDAERLQDTISAVNKLQVVDYLLKRLLHNRPGPVCSIVSR